MYYYDDPITDKDISVTNFAQAVYALKICNDNHFAVYYQGQEMLKELSRLSEEIYNQKYALIEPYLPAQVIVEGAPKVIPNPLPSNIPASVIAAMNFLDAQYNEVEEIYQAELARDTSELKETISELESKVAEWYKNHVNASWTGRKHTITLSGCELKYNGGNVTFDYTELN